MNAYELADELVVASSEMEYNHVVNDWKLLYDSSTMLRQQADRIAELEAKVSAYEIQLKEMGFLK